VTSVAQDALNALIIKYPLCPLAVTSTKAITDPLPESRAPQNPTLPNAPTTAPAGNKGWKIVEGKAMQRKRKSKKVGYKQTITMDTNTPTMKNSGRGKNTHQPQQKTPSAKKTWAEVVKSSSINIQIVLGNSNLRLAIPMTI
jgi:hypothetical protein